MSFSLLRLHLRRPERNGQPKMETRRTMAKRKQVSVVIKFLFLRNVHLSHFLLDEIASKQASGSMSPPPPAKKSRSELARFYEAAVEGRSLR